MKGLTVDLVVTGDESAAVAEAVDAVRRGQRVLVVLRSGGPRVVPRLRRLCQAAKSQLTVMTNAEVVCVDGVGGVEAVIVRYIRTGRVRGVNTTAFLSCDGSKNRCTWIRGSENSGSSDRERQAPVHAHVISHPHRSAPTPPNRAPGVRRRS